MDTETRPTQKVTAEPTPPNTVTCNHEDSPKPSECFLYNTELKPTCIEKVFGESYHVKDEYIGHQISWSFVLCIMAIYMVQGARDSLNIAMSYYFPIVFNTDPAELQAFFSLLIMPWTIKIVYGLIIDAFPICGYKRKLYLLFFGSLAPVAVIIAATIGSHSYDTQLWTGVLNSICTAFCDVIADALIVERTQFKSHTVAARLQALAWGSRTTSAIITILIGTNLQKSQKPEDILKVWWLYFAVSLLTPIFGIFLPEKRVGSYSSVDTVKTGKDVLSLKQIFRLSLQTLCRKSIFYPNLFLFILQCTPTTTEPLRYFMIFHLGFDSVQIGYLTIAGSCAFLLAIGYVTLQSRKSNKLFSLRKQFFSWTLIGAFLPFITLILLFEVNQKLGIPDYAFALTDQILTQVVVWILFVCKQIVFSRMCPPGIEGFFMTVLTSIANVGMTFSYGISSSITDALQIECDEDPDDEDNVICDFNNLWIMVIIANLTTLIPLVLIKTIPNEKDLQEINDKLQTASNAIKDEANEEGNELNKDEMIGIYWFCLDKIFSRCKCKCCDKNKKSNNITDDAQISGYENGDDKLNVI